MKMKVSMYNQDFFVEEGKIDRYEQATNFNIPENPDNLQKRI